GARWAGHGGLEQATEHANRIATRTSQRAAPEARNEEAIAALRQAEADVAGRKADVARAKLNLDYATIRAPIRGTIGAALVSEGALVDDHDADVGFIRRSRRGRGGRLVAAGQKRNHRSEHQCNACRLRAIARH